MKLNSDIKKLKKQFNRRFDMAAKQITRDASRPLNREEVVLITAFSFIVVFFQILGAMLNVFNWAFGSGNINFDSYHPLAPVVGVLGYMLYTTCLWYKGVRYWLAYVPAIVAFAYNALLYSIMHGYVTLDMLREFLSQFPFITSI